MILSESNIKVTMTGLPEAMEMTRKATMQIVELRELLNKLEFHCLSMGIEINQPSTCSAADLGDATTQNELQS